MNFVVGDSLNAYTLSQSDVAFHFNPRFTDQCVVRNSKVRGVWDDNEERFPAKFLPFAPGQAFQLMILVESDMFKIAVNGRHEFEFKHRIPMVTANILEIGGDVSIRRIDFKPYSGNNNGPSSPFAKSLINLYNPVVPLYYPIPGLQTNSLIYISGKPTMFFSRFNINFLRTVGSSNPDTIFHFDVRRTFSGSSPAVVRNSQIDGSWGREERIAPSFPFASGVNFDLMIRVESSRFLVAVNGQHFIDYPHRTEYQNTNILSIEGDVTISSIRVTQ